MYSIAEIKQIRLQADELGLYAPPLFWELPESELVKICNGCGAESMPEWSRELLTWLYRNYTAAHCIHDAEYELSDGTEISRCEADAEFYENCLVLWKHKYGWSRWINPIALYGLKKIRLAYRALQCCGRPAWKEAFEKRKAKENISNA